MISTGNGSLLFTGDLTEDKTSLMKLYFLLRFVQLTGQHLTVAMDNDVKATQKFLKVKWRVSESYDYHPTKLYFSSN